MFGFSIDTNALIFDYSTSCDKSESQDVNHLWNACTTIFITLVRQIIIRRAVSKIWPFRDSAHF